MNEVGAGRGVEPHEVAPRRILSSEPHLPCCDAGFFLFNLRKFDVHIFRRDTPKSVPVAVSKAVHQKQNPLPGSARFFHFATHQERHRAKRLWLLYLEYSLAIGMIGSFAPLQIYCYDGSVFLSDIQVCLWGNSKCARCSTYQAWITTIDRSKKYWPDLHRILLQTVSLHDSPCKSRYLRGHPRQKGFLEAQGLRQLTQENRFSCLPPKIRQCPLVCLEFQFVHLRGQWRIVLHAMPYLFTVLA